MDYHDLENMVFQVEEHGVVNMKAEDNDPMEEDDHAPENIVEDDGTNTLIHDTFSTGAADHDDQDDFDVVHDLPVIEKAYEPLYKGSQTTPLYYIVVGELEGYEWFIQHNNLTYVKVCHKCHIFSSIFIVISSLVNKR